MIGPAADGPGGPATRRAAIMLVAGGVLAVLVLVVTGTQGAGLLVLVAVLALAVASVPRRWALGMVVLVGGASILVYGAPTLFVVASAVEGVAGTPPPAMDRFAVGATAALVCWSAAVGAAAFHLARGRWRTVIIGVTLLTVTVPVAWWFVA